MCLPHEGIKVKFILLLYYNSEFDHTACNLIGQVSDASWDILVMGNVTNGMWCQYNILWCVCYG